MYKFVIFGLFVAAAVALPAQEVKEAAGLDCVQEDAIFSCLAVKATAALNRAARSSNVQLIDGITFVRDTPMERSGRAMNDNDNEVELLNALPRELSDRTMKLLAMMYDGALSFLKSHSLKIDLPDESFSRALVEGRGKIKKIVLSMIAAAGFKIFAVIPIVLGALALLVIKALIVGKIALIVAGALAFQKMFGASSVGSVASSWFNKAAQPAATYYEPATAQAWSNGGASQQPQQGYYKRSFDDIKSDAQSLAYSSHAPNSAS